MPPGWVSQNSPCVFKVNIMVIGTNYHFCVNIKTTIIFLYDIEVVLDLAQIKLNEFIKNVDEDSAIKDMSIDGLEMEYIIKELYQA